MAAKKQINEMNEKISVELRFPTYVGYTDYFLSTPVSVQLRNDSEIGRASCRERV